MFENVYKGKKIFVTGNTGFKGSWLCFWLMKLGANVCGYSLNLPTDPNHHEILNLDFETLSGDVRDLKKLQRSIEAFQPDIVFHMAAQSLVRKSYQSPVETFESNVIGTVNVFEACRKADYVRAIVNITSDKCYENQEWIWGYRENDPMGGHDPYSASKGCAELVTASYRKSFFPLEEYQKSHQTLVASARAGNVIGGGDWGDNRLVPDIMRAAGQNEKAIIRNPQATRPWQHVLEPLSGYLLLGQQLFEGKKEFSEAWNFGPTDEGNRNVLAVVRELQKHWSNIDYQIKADKKNPHEANLLKLDCSKAYAKLKWESVWNSSDTFVKTVQWYKMYYESGRVCSEEQLAEYITDAKHKQISWAVE
ncbi:MAG: CDP-glucose 4,6-dehydratase [Deltaproteobacteria bacterium]|nr:CDP-glucose 4,6-dehydratase [Deltaproteobacteria bacterium]MBW2663208.1 CDP-glucose 4,6-dehydratase [Deltaproteobacteria bacterium]